MSDAKIVCLTKKLPTRPSPPKLSIFVATPWPMDMRQYDNTNSAHIPEPDDDFETEEWSQYYNRSNDYEDPFGQMPDGEGAMKILYKGHSLRIFPHEFNVSKPENLEMYLAGVIGEVDPSHTMEIMDTGSAFLRDMLEDSQSEVRLSFDAARLDGADYIDALATALACDIEGIAQLFWWKPRREYAEYFCHDFEMTEDEALS